MLEDHTAEDCGQPDRARFAFDFGGGVQDLEDSPRSRKALLDGVGNRSQVRDLPVELLQQAGKDNQAAPERDAPSHIKPTAVGKQDDKAQLGKELRGRREQGQVEENPLLLV